LRLPDLGEKDDSKLATPLNPHCGDWGEVFNITTCGHYDRKLATFGQDLSEP
jgi:hypothetical protein